MDCYSLNSKHILIISISVFVFASISVLLFQTNLFSMGSIEDSSNVFFEGAYLEYNTEVNVEFGNSTDKISNTVSGKMRQDVIKVSTDSITLRTSSSGELRDIIGDEEEDTVSTIRKGDSLFDFDINTMNFIGEEKIQTMFGEKNVRHYSINEKTSIEGGTLLEIQSVYIGKDNNILLLVESSSISEMIYRGGIVTSTSNIKTWLSDTNLEWLK